MRRTLISLLILPALMLVATGPAMAANPTEKGVSTSFGAGSRSCDETTCTFFSLTAYNTDSIGPNPDYLQVCLSVTTESLLTPDLLDRAEGCVQRDLSELTVTDDLTAMFGPTRIRITHLDGTLTRVRVSAFAVAEGPLDTFEARLQVDADNCIYRYWLHQETTDADGTMTIDGTTLPSSGFVSVRQYKSKLLYCRSA